MTNIFNTTEPDPHGGKDRAQEDSAGSSVVDLNISGGWTSSIVNELREQTGNHSNLTPDQVATKAEEWRRRQEAVAQAAFEDEVNKQLFNIEARREALRLADAREGADGTGWVDVADIIDAGAQPPEPPGIFQFEDDPERGLLYENRYNCLFGAEGQGKSLLMAAIQAWYINQGRHVVHVECDNNPAAQVIWRVVGAGADPKLVREYLHVLVNEVVIPPFEFEPAFVTLDSVNAAITLLGGEHNASSSGVDLMVQRLIDPFLRRGATALSLDHINNTDTTRPSNNRRKIQAVQGNMLSIAVQGEPGRVGTRWMSALTLTKDNPGWCHVPVGQVYGYAVFDGTAGDGTCQVALRKVPSLADLHQALKIDEDLGAELREILLEASPQRLPVNDITTRYCASREAKDHKDRRTITRALNSRRAKEQDIDYISGTGTTATKYWFVKEATLDSH